MFDNERQGDSIKIKSHHGKCSFQVRNNVRHAQDIISHSLIRLEKHCKRKRICTIKIPVSQKIRFDQGSRLLPYIAVNGCFQDGNGRLTTVRLPSVFLVEESLNGMGTVTVRRYRLYREVWSRCAALLPRVLQPVEGFNARQTLTLTRAKPYPSQWVRVWVAWENPRVTRDNHYS